MSAPQIDQRDYEKILKQIQELAPFYTPEWNPDSGDSGSALVRIFAQMFEGIIKRSNQVPDKNFIEFLNMLGAKLLPARQARAPVVFSLSPGAAQPVLIPAGTQVAANPADGGDPVIFETERNILATPAKLVDIYCVNPDEIYKAPPELLSGEGAALVFKLFEGRNLQEHILYIGHNDLLNLENQAEIQLLSPVWNALFKNEELVKWEYYGEHETLVNGDKVKQEKWFELELNTSETSAQKLVLRKKLRGEMKETEIGGIKNRWIRCVANSAYIKTLKEVVLSSVKMTVKPLMVNEGVPEQAYYDCEEKAFYIGDRGIFNTNNRAVIELTFRGWRPKLDDSAKFNWQYYGERSGHQNWYDLETAGTTGKIILKKDNNDELPEHQIKGFNSRWIRCLIKPADMESLESFPELAESLDLTEFLQKYISNLPLHIRLWFERYIKNIFRSHLDRAGMKESAVYGRALFGAEKIVLDNGRIILDYEEVLSELWKAVAGFLEKRIKNVNAAVEDNPYINPDLLFNNDVPLELPSEDKPVCPFGKLPRTYDTFYLGCSEAFSKKGGVVILDIDVSGGTSVVPVGMVQGIGTDFAGQLMNHKRDDNTPEPIDTVEKLLKKTPQELTKILTVTTGDKKEKAITLTKAVNLLEAAQKEFYDKTGIYRPISSLTASIPDEDLMLSWEYWDGKGWKAISGISDSTNKLRQKGTLEFNCPEDLNSTSVNGQDNLWIRVRIISGDYGKERFISPDGKTWQSDTSQIKPPVLNYLRIRYSSMPVYPENGLTYNNLEFADIINEITDSTKTVKPFLPLDDSNCALYLGFESPPLKGPVSIFFSLEEQEYTERNRPLTEWQYYRIQNKKGEWARLEVLDGTSSLTESGALEFIGPADFSSNRRFGGNLYWIRAVTPPSPAPLIKGIYINTGWTVQAETVKDEILGSSNGEPDQSFTLVKFPVISEEVWVNEYNSLSEGERRNLAGNKDVPSQEIRDQNNVVTEFWVKWNPVEDFLESGPSERHYMIDRAFGRVRFGDGINGAVPPVGTDNIKAGFRAGGGSRGNVGAFEITELKTSIAFVDGIYNPESADGGSDIETIEQAVERAPQNIKHQNRAVTMEDYEWLAKEASRNIARVKCLPNLDDKKDCSTGWITVVIVPNSSQEKPVPSLRLKKQVEKFLSERTANVIAFPKHLKVIGPAYIEIYVEAVLVAKDFDMVPEVENKAVKGLKALLHPLTGGDIGRGWDFGRFPYLSDFFGLLEGIEGADHVESLSMVIKYDDGREIRVDSKDSLDMTHIKCSPYSLVYSGKHNIRVKALTG